MSCNCLCANGIFFDEGASYRDMFGVFVGKSLSSFTSFLTEMADKVSQYISSAPEESRSFSNTLANLAISPVYLCISIIGLAETVVRIALTIITAPFRLCLSKDTNLSLDALTYSGAGISLAHSYFSLVSGVKHLGCPNKVSLSDVKQQNPLVNNFFIYCMGK